MNWLGSYYFEVTVAGREENEVEDQQTADAILSINYRDKVGQKLFFGPNFYIFASGRQHKDSSRSDPTVED